MVGQVTFSAGNADFKSLEVKEKVGELEGHVIKPKGDGRYGLDGPDGLNFLSFLFLK